VWPLNDEYNKIHKMEEPSNKVIKSQKLKNVNKNKYIASVNNIMSGIGLEPTTFSFSG
jgi:hypothetical protein